MTIGSCFSGIGGELVAASMLGWEVKFFCEKNPFGRTVLEYWYPNAKSYEDITTTDFSEWRGQIDVLTGGFPCQPFSYAGQRRGSKDDRYLWPSMHNAIDEIQPTWVVAENVAGILTMVEQGEVSKVAGSATFFDAFDDLRGRYELRETYTLQRICSDFESQGYAVQPVLIPACAVGAPHRRDRVFIVARRVKSVTEDTMLGGQLHRPNEEQGSERNERHTCAGGGERICRSSSGTVAADNESKQGECIKPRQLEASGTTQVQFGRGGGEVSGQPDFAYTELEYCGERWQNFPSVSPVHRGNDGFPFDVDRLTLSFGKWRTEALQAYGNAIVPQVMYEIFFSIEQVERSLKQLKKNPPSF